MEVTGYTLVAEKQDSDETSFSAGSAAVATAAKATTAVAALKNTYSEQPGSLKITKQVTVNGAPVTDANKTLADGTYSFTVASTTLDPLVSKKVTITIANGAVSSAAIDGEAVAVGSDGFVIVSDLKADTYTITETAPTNGTALTKINEIAIAVDTAVSDPKATVAVTAGDIATVPTATFTNNIDTGDLSISKTVVSDVAADQDKDFTFTIELKAGSNAVTGKYDAAWKLNGTTVTVGKVTFGTDGKATIKLHGKETVELTGLPVGTAWKVTETVETDYDTTIKVNGTDKTEAADTISAADEKDVAAFTNTRKTGELTLKKTVESPVDEDNSKDYTFTITLDVDVNGTFTATGAESSVTFTNGVAEVKLAADENITIKGLPANVEYTVVEDAEAYMVTGSTGEAGTIPAEDKAEVAFTNKRDQGERGNEDGEGRQERDLWCHQVHQGRYVQLHDHRDREHHGRYDLRLHAEDREDCGRADLCDRLDPEGNCNLW